MGQHSSQIVAEPSVATPAPLTTSSTASLPRQAAELEPEASTNKNDNGASPSHQPQTQLSNKKRRGAESADFDQGSVLPVTQPRLMAKSKSKTEQKPQRQDNSGSARHDLHGLSKDEFLSALTEDAQPVSSFKSGFKATKQNTVSVPTTSKRKRDQEDGALPDITGSNKRPRTYSKKGAHRSASRVLPQRTVTPEPDANGRGLVSSPNSLIIQSSKRPAASLNSQKPSSSSATTTPVSSTKASQVGKSRGQAQSENGGRASRLSIPKQPSAPELRLPNVSTTQQVFSSKPIANPGNGAEDLRRAAIADNYKKSIGKVERKRAELSTEEVAANGGGPFTQQELVQANELKAEFCREKTISEEAFDALLHASTRSNGNAVEVWSNIYEAYPYRKRDTLQKIFRRIFHPYSRTVGWTKEEDQELKDLVESLGKKWKDISSRIDRRPEDARDRWRNYLQYDNQKKEKWDAEEVLALGTAVGNLMYNVLCEKRGEAQAQGTEAPATLSNDECRKLVEWHAVCQKVPGRSRLQCLQKWSDLERSAMTSFENEIREAARRASGAPDSAPPVKIKLLEGDRLRLCKALATSGADLVSDVSWKNIRSQKLEVFSKKILRKAWQQLSLDLLSESERLESEVNIATAATLVRRRLKKVTPKDRRKLYWSKNGQDTRPSPEPPTLSQHYPALLKRQQDAALRKQERKEKEVGVSARAFKSSEFVSESDSEASA